MPAHLAPALRLLVRVALAAVVAAVLIAAVVTAVSVVQVTWGVITTSVCHVVTDNPTTCTPERITR